MIEIARDAPGSVACGRSGRPLLAVCSSGHRRMIPFRLLKTSETDRTPLYAGSSSASAFGGDGRAASRPPVAPAHVGPTPT